MRICSIEGCDKKIHGHGLCHAHNSRRRVYGDPLKGPTGYGEVQRYLMEIVLKHNGEACLIWPYSTNGNGYGQIRRSGRPQIVSRIVCAETHGPAPTPKHDAAHNCGKGHLGCVNPHHLRWATKSENHSDKLAHGTHCRGEQHSQSKLTTSQVFAIRRMKGHMAEPQIAAQFGVTDGCIRRILLRKTWGWLDGPPFEEISLGKRKQKAA